MKLPILGILVVVAIAVSISEGEMSCNEKNCTATAVVGEHFNYTKTFIVDINETNPTSSEGCDMENALCVITPGDHSLEIKGKVPADADRFEFKNGNNTVYTYIIKKGETDPVCVPPNICSTPPFVTFENDTIKPETVTVPFEISNPMKVFIANGDYEQVDALATPTATCASDRVCITQDSTQPLTVKIEGVVTDNAYAIVFTDENGLQAVTYISNKANCLEGSNCTTPANIVKHNGKLVPRSVKITTTDFDATLLKAAVYANVPHSDSVGVNTVNATLNSALKAFTVKGLVKAGGQRIKFYTKPKPIYYTLLTSHKVDPTGRATEPKYLTPTADSKVDGTIFIPANVTIRHIGLVESDIIVADILLKLVFNTECFSNKEVCVQVYGSKIWFSGIDFIQVFKIVFTYKESADASVTKTATIFFSREDAQKYCKTTADDMTVDDDGDYGDDGKVPCTSPTNLRSSNSDYRFELPAGASYMDVTAELYIVQDSYISNGASMKKTCRDADTICITPTTKATVVTIVGKVNPNAKYLEFSQTSAESGQIKARTYIQHGEQAVTCEGTCTAPHFIKANGDALTSTHVTVPFVTMNLNTELYVNEYKKLANASDTLDGIPVCPNGKMCVTLSTSGASQKATFEGDFTGMKKVVFTVDNSIKKKMSTYFSDVGTESCPGSDICTDTAFVKLSGAKREVTLTGTANDSVVTTALWTTGEYKVKNAFGGTNQCDPSKEVCIASSISSKRLEIKGKIDELPQVVTVNLTNNDVWTYTFSSTNTSVTASINTPITKVTTTASDGFSPVVDNFDYATTTTTASGLAGSLLLLIFTVAFPAMG